MGRRNSHLLLSASSTAHCECECQTAGWMLAAQLSLCLLHGSRVSVPLKEQLTSRGCSFWERSGFKAAIHSAVPVGVTMSFSSACRHLVPGDEEGGEGRIKQSWAGKSRDRGGNDRGEGRW